MCLSNVKISHSIAMLYIFEDNEVVIKVIIEARSPTMRHVSRTRGLVVWQNQCGSQDSNIRYIARSHTYWLKDTSHVTNWNIFFVCSTSANTALSAAPRISAWLAAPKRWQKGCKNSQKKTGLWRNPGQRRWTWPVLLASSSSANSAIASRSPGILKASSRQVGLSGRPDAQAHIKIPIPTQRRVLKDGNGMLNCSSAEGNLWQLITKDVQDIPKFQKIQKIQNRKVEFGPMISVYHQTVYLRWRKSSRS